MLVEHDLASGRASRSDTETVYYIVETTFEELEKHLTGNAFSAGCTLEKVAELTFKNAICIFSFLLFLKLSAVFGSLATAVVAVLARGIILFGQNFIFTVDGLCILPLFKIFVGF